MSKLKRKKKKSNKTGLIMTRDSKYRKRHHCTEESLLLHSSEKHLFVRWEPAKVWGFWISEGETSLYFRLNHSSGSNSSTSNKCFFFCHTSKKFELSCSDHHPFPQITIIKHENWNVKTKMCRNAFRSLNRKNLTSNYYYYCECFKTYTSGIKCFWYDMHPYFHTVN